MSTYTNAWTAISPVGGDPAKDWPLNDRKIRVDIQERADALIGQANWSGAVDPIIDGTTIKSLKALTTALSTAAVMTGVSAGQLARVTGAGTLGPAHAVESAKRVVSINSNAGTWTVDVTKAFNLLQNDASSTKALGTINLTGTPMLDTAFSMMLQADTVFNWITTPTWQNKFKFSANTAPASPTAGQMIIVNFIYILANDKAYETSRSGIITF